MRPSAHRRDRRRQLGDGHGQGAGGAFGRRQQAVGKANTGAGLSSQQKTHHNQKYGPYHGTQR
jgi:hypothetical protein